MTDRNVHSLKCWPEPFQAVWDKKKVHEIRKYDRKFEVGNILWLKEWKPAHVKPCEWDSPRNEHQSGVDDYHCRHCKRAKTDPMPGTYTGRWIAARVTHVTLPGEWGLPLSPEPGICVMSIGCIQRHDSMPPLPKRLA